MSQEGIAVTALLPLLTPAGPRAPGAVLRISHRGRSGHVDIAEPAAYGAPNLRRVAEQGAHLVELDLRATRDDRLVVHHDPAVNAGGDGVIDIATHDFAEIPGQVPAATDVFAAAESAGLGVYIDIKAITEPGVRALASLLMATDLTHRAILASTEAGIVAMCSQVMPGLPRSVLFRAVATDPVPLAAAARAHFVHPCWEDAAARPDKLLSGRWLARVHQHDLGVICWHEERPDVVNGLLALGVDGICSDEPELLTQLAYTNPLAP